MIHLDMCCINRPLDDKTQVRILVEGEAVLGIIALCESGQAELLSSDALEYELGRNPNPVRRTYPATTGFSNGLGRSIPARRRSLAALI